LTQTRFNFYFPFMDKIQPVKLFAAVLFRDSVPPDDCYGELIKVFGQIDYYSPAAPFDVTDYYQKEMGAPLSRILVSFERLAAPAGLPDIKLKSVAVEELLRLHGNRTVNIDTGYLDFDKVVLASTKKGPYKVCMDKGIWADMTLHYEKGAFHPFPWTFADFKDNRYNPYLLRIRELYKKACHSD
jgi:hypothetical protein